MSVRLMPLAWNVLDGITPSTGVSSFMKGHPPANATNTDVRRQAIARGIFTVTLGVDDAIDVLESAVELNSAVAAGTYLSPMLVAAAAQTAINDNSSPPSDGNWIVYWAQDGTNRYKFVFEHASASLLPRSGTNTATSFLRLKAGTFEDNSTLVADAPAIHDNLTGDVILYDCTEKVTSQCAALINPLLSAGARPSIRFGDSSAVTDAQEVFGDYDPELMATFYTAHNYQHHRVDLLDPRNADATSQSAGGQVGLGYLYVGPYFEPSINWEWDAFAAGPEIRSTVARSSITGQPFISEVAVGQRITLAWASRPGIDPSEIPAFEGMLRQVGRNDGIIVAADPTGDPNGQTGLFRVASDPQPARVMTQSPRGRWGLQLELERVAVR